MATKWNPSFKSSAVTLSNGDLVATTVYGNYGFVRSTESHANGKFYFEVEQTTYISSEDYGSILGCGCASATTTDYEDSSVSDYIDVAFQGSYIYIGRRVAEEYTELDTIENTFSNGLIVQFAIDFDNNRFWVGFNNTWNGNPAAGTGYYSTTFNEAFYPDARLSFLGSVITGKFTSADFSYAPPSGFSEWDAEEGGGELPEGFYAHTHKLLCNGLDWNSASLRVALVTSSYSFDENHTSYSDISAYVISTSPASNPTATNSGLFLGNSEFIKPNSSFYYVILYVNGTVEGIANPLLLAVSADAVVQGANGPNLTIAFDPAFLL